MLYHVTLDFKKPPSLSLDVEAPSAQEAVQIARREAPNYGFDEPVKKSAVREAHTNPQEQR